MIKICSLPRSKTIFQREVTRRRNFTRLRILFSSFFLFQSERKLNSLRVSNLSIIFATSFPSRNRVKAKRAAKNGEIFHLWSTDPWAEAPPLRTGSSVIAVNEPPINLCRNPNISESISIGKQFERVEMALFDSGRRPMRWLPADVGGGREGVN